MKPEQWNLYTYCTWTEGSEVQLLLFLFHTEEFGWLGQSVGGAKLRERRREREREVFIKDIPSCCFHLHAPVLILSPVSILRVRKTYSEIISTSCSYVTDCKTCLWHHISEVSVCLYLHCEKTSTCLCVMMKMKMMNDLTVTCRPWQKDIKSVVTSVKHVKEKVSKLCRGVVMVTWCVTKFWPQVTSGELWGVRETPWVSSTSLCVCVCVCVCVI